VKNRADDVENGIVAEVHENVTVRFVDVKQKNETVFRRRRRISSKSNCGRAIAIDPFLDCRRRQPCFRVGLPTLGQTRVQTTRNNAKTKKEKQ